MSSKIQAHPYLVPHPISVAVLPDQYPVDNSLVKTRAAGHMGRGLFAAKDMPAGTRILSETPLIMVPGNPKDRTLAENIAALCKAVLRVDSNTHHILLILSTSDKSVEYDSQTSEAVRDWFIKTVPKEMYLLEWCVSTYSRLFSFYQVHAVGLPGLDASGFFYRHGVINHSCSPNAHAYYDPVKERHQVHLVRDVKAGDQVFVSYIEGNEFSRAYRHSEIRLEGHKFICDCTLCTSQQAEAIMQRVPAAYRGLTNYSKRAHMRIDQNNSAVIPRSESVEALASAEELLRLLRHPSVDIVGPPLSRALQFCSWIHRSLGNFQAAAMCERERLALQVRLYGFEAENFLDDNDASIKLDLIERELSRMEAGGPWGSPLLLVEVDGV